MLRSSKCSGWTVGQSGLAAWSAKSTDFNPLDCYIWGRLEVFCVLRQQRVEDGELIRNMLEHFWAQGTVLNWTQGQSCGHHLVMCGNTSSQLFILLCSSPFKIIWTIADRRRFLYIFAEYNQKDATFLNSFVSVRSTTCFRWFFRPSSGAQNCTYSARHLSDQCCYLLLAWSA